VLQGEGDRRAQGVIAPSVMDEDHLALAAACAPDVGLCTIVGIEGSFSRRLGAQLAILPDGEVVGDLADTCLERQLVTDLRDIEEPAVVRYGAGSPKIDFRLPCGGGLDILLDPAPDRAACRHVLERLDEREPASLALPGNARMAERAFIPSLRLRVFGEGAEPRALGELAEASGVMAELIGVDALSLGRGSGLPAADAWTAVLLLFHDHEWEMALLEEALASPAFYIGAQGGKNAREGREELLRERGHAPDAIGRIRSPVGALPACRTARALALSALTEIVGDYERLRPGA